MEIFMRDISYSVMKHQLTTELAKILHGPRYARFSSTPLNFHVYLFKDKKGTRRHAGSGALTLTTNDVGDQFLAEYGDGVFCANPFVIGGRQIKFTKSKHPARVEVIESIARRPYIDPKAIEEKGKKDVFLSTEEVSIKTIQFGWECRDSVFSIEWEESFQGCFLSFDDNRREIRIKVAHTSGTLIIAIRFSQIILLSVHTYLSEQAVIYFSLDMPPVFELETSTTSTRQRLAALPIADHARVAPYTSYAIRLICANHHNMLKFIQLCKIVQLHNFSESEHYVDRRALFAQVAMEELEQWLRQLNWCVSFQIESIVRSLSADVTEMLTLMPHIRNLIREKGKYHTASVLRYFKPRAKELFWDPYEPQEISIEECFILAEKEFAMQLELPLRPTDGSLFEAYHATITPTSILLEGPFPERSNRVIRMYNPAHHESFLRVSFMEEGHLQYRFDRDVDGPGFIRSHVGQFLLHGLTIARRKFRFLAYSQSALKEHAVWFVKGFRDTEHGYVDASVIIQSLGSFDNLDFDPDLMRCPARYGARLSQAFTATDASVTIEEVEEIFRLDDIKTDCGKYCFTDGVGTMSKELAVEISQELRSKRRRGRYNKVHPRAFQIRLMGSKGMLSVDHKLRGRAVCLRPSMIKFEAPHSLEIEIARAFDRPGVYYLNRPLIMLLEGLGVPYSAFQRFQDKAVEETWQATHSLAQAARTLESHGLGTSYRLPSIMLTLGKLGVDNIHDDVFYRHMLEYAINHILRSLKNHARIPIPDAWTLVGVADIHKFLKEGEIFACVKPIHGRVIYLEGPVLVSRSPTIHPGDVQVAHAIGLPPVGSCFEKEALPNTVVFSIVGTRPLPSCLGGGDLDGDIYNVLPLNELPDFMPSRTEKPAAYVQADKKLLDRSSTMADVAQFVMEYIISDVVGIIAITWLILADQSPDGIFDKDCLELSRLHSDAVDYPKSGNPVALQKIPRLRFRDFKPDWNAPETVKPDSTKYYVSNRAIGKLFRAIDLPEIPNHGGRGRRRRQTQREQSIDELANGLTDLAVTDIVHEVVEERVSQFIDVDAVPSRNNIEHIRSIYHRYVTELKYICTSSTLSHTKSVSLSEEEAIVGTVAQKSSQPRKRTNMISRLREQTDVLVRGIREELMGGDEVPLEESLEGAWTAWKLSILEQKSFGGQSFGWLALGTIFDIIKEIEEMTSIN